MITQSKQSEEIEEIFNPNNKRTRLFPIPEHTKPLWDEYIKHKSAHWVATEIQFSQDLNDWNMMDKEQRHFYKMVLAFFANSDMIVNEKEERDSEKFSYPEISFYIRNKMEREDEHTITYHLHLETLVNDEKERELLFNAVKNIKSIKNKADWCNKYIKNGSPIQNLVMGACVEGIFFSSSFCSIFYSKKNGKMPGLCQSNEFISKDEGSHRDFACMLYRGYIKNKLPEQEVISMIKECVVLEQEFVVDALPINLIGMNSELMCQYVEYVADNLSMNLIGKVIYGCKNPFPWMKIIGADVKTSFFDKTGTNYSVNNDENTIRFDSVF
jgi:ribonucleoside-diphosphate reductase beta chain